MEKKEEETDTLQDKVIKERSKCLKQLSLQSYVRKINSQKAHGISLNCKFPPFTLESQQNYLSM